MLREKVSETLKEAMKAKDSRRVSALRLIMAKLKDKDIEVRVKGNMTGILDGEIQQMMQSMIKQRRESIELYTKGNRSELAAQEQGEIDVIETFLPQQLDDAALETAVKGVVAATGASSIKDMGKVMAGLKEAHGGQYDPSKASLAVKKVLGG